MSGREGRRFGVEGVFAQGMIARGVWRREEVIRRRCGKTGDEKRRGKSEWVDSGARGW